jgi:anaerobic selenocysteine-containing dehydrogenase
VSVSTNLVMASLGEETRASCRGPADHNAVALILPHKSLLGFTGGAIGADIYRDRSGILCRTLADCAKVLFGRWQSRVSGRPEVGGKIPSSTMAEEMLTPGDGQVRAIILLMINPLRSAANSAQLEAAFAHLDFLVAVDFYINETTRHAHVILPSPSPAEQPHYEFGLYHLAVRNVTKWSWPAVSSPPGSPAAWQVVLHLSAIFMGLAGRSTREIDDVVFRQLATAAVEHCTWPKLSVEAVGVGFVRPSPVRLEGRPT